MRQFFMAAAAAAALGCGLTLPACQSATPFQAATPGGHGYSDFRIDAMRWRVTFNGNTLTSRETVEKYLLYRAAQLTIQQGFDWFEPTERQTERNTRYVGTSSYWSTWGSRWNPNWGFGGPGGMRRHGPWGPGPGWPNDIDVRQVNRYEASSEIVMGKGPPPSGRQVIDARQVLENLGPSVAKPEES